MFSTVLLLYLEVGQISCMYMLEFVYAYNLHPMRTVNKVIYMTLIGLSCVMEMVLVMVFLMN